uniref:beta-N-acetylhexosaminidase n=1 Tax=Triticum urartu TaxID=4572 RepID=A0A8R7K4Z0_TRIUA
MAPALMRLALALAVAVVGCCAARQPGGRVDLWPMPASVSRGARTLYVARDLKLSTAGSGYKDGKAILADAFRRMVAVIQLDHAINGSYHGLPVLAGVNVAVRSPDDELKFGVDESYKLTVPATGSPLYARIEAQTVFGAFHALETFSQLCYFDFVLSVTGLHWAPWTIVDKPRFPYRGLLIDTARHYLPVPVIKSVIDSMVYSKLNVLHWHIVDEQSFPLEIPSYPKLSNGAYSYSEKYTINDAIDIVQYAEKRGVNVLAEIDVPGHAGSWGVGYPSLWPSATCQQPLDVSNDFTFKVIDGILSDFSKVFKFKFVHLGGDEVDTSCWTTTPRIKSWYVL